MISTIAIIVIHWKVFESYAWPKVVLITDKIGIFTKIALILGINPIRFKEILYMLFDFISLLIIILSIRKFNVRFNILSIITMLAALLYFVFYPYNRLMDACFRGLYVLMTLGSSLSIYALISIISDKNIKQTIKDSFIYSLFLLIVFITVGQWDPRIFLYPLIIILSITIIQFIILIISRYVKFFIKSLIFIVPLTILLYAVGKIRMKLAESISPIVPFNLNAFLGFYDVFHLTSGTSWILVNKPSLTLIHVASLLLTVDLLLIILFLTVMHSVDEQIYNIRAYIYALILIYISIMIFELNIHNVVKFFLMNREDGFLFAKLSIIKYILLMFRVPRFMDFTNKTIITTLIILAGYLISKVNKISESSTRINAILILIMIISLSLALCNGFMLRPLINRGAIFNPNPKSITFLGIPSKILTRSFPIADWNKEKILLNSFLFGKIKIGSLQLYDHGVIPIEFKPYADKFIRAGFFVKIVRLHKFFAVVLLNRTLLYGRPILIPQGLYLGSIVWSKGYVPIYLDQIIPRRYAKELINLHLPIVIYKNKYIIEKNLAVWLLLNRVVDINNSNLIILVPSKYTTCFISSLTCWSPGFIGDPHQGIFYEPGNYEYDYTYKLNWGVIQGRDVYKPFIMHFFSKRTGNYIILLRLMSTGKGILDIYIDNMKYSLAINRTETIDSRLGFIWFNISNVTIQKGIHTLRIYWISRNKNHPTIYINLVLIIPRKLWQQAFEYAMKYIEKYGINMINLQKFFKKSQIHIKESIENYPFIGKKIIIKITVFNANISPIAFDTRILWGYTLRVHGSGTRIILSVPIDYVKAGILVVPYSKNFSIYIEGYEGYTTPKGLLEILFADIATVVLLYFIFTEAYKIKRYSIKYK